MTSLRESLGEIEARALVVGTTDETDDLVLVQELVHHRPLGPDLHIIVLGHGLTPDRRLLTEGVSFLRACHHQYGAQKREKRKK